MSTLPTAIPVPSVAARPAHEMFVFVFRMVGIMLGGVFGLSNIQVVCAVLSPGTDVSTLACWLDDDQVSCHVECLLAPAMRMSSSWIPCTQMPRQSLMQQVPNFRIQLQLRLQEVLDQFEASTASSDSGPRTHVYGGGTLSHRAYHTPLRLSSLGFACEDYILLFRVPLSQSQVCTTGCLAFVFFQEIPEVSPYTLGIINRQLPGEVHQPEAPGTKRSRPC
jgi:hypothetical protein